MKRLVYGCSELLVADRTADLLLEYAVALIMQNSVDVVQLTAFLPAVEGAMDFRLLVGAQVPLVARNSDDERPAPDNRVVELRMREQIARLTAQPSYAWTTADLFGATGH
jgi:hypothetical protein